MSGTKVVKNNIFFLLLLQGANYLLPLITLPYIVRTIGVDKFGIIALANVAVAYFTILIDYGFNLSATREISIYRNDKKKIGEIFYSVIIIKLILLFFSFLILISLILIFDTMYQYRDIYFYSFFLLVGRAVFPVWYFQGIEKMGYITFLNIGSKVFFALLIFLFVDSSYDYYLVPLINSTGFVIGGLMGFYLAIKNIPFLLPKPFIIVKYFKESTHLFISNLSSSLFTSSNTLILGLFTDHTTVGIYSSIERLIMAVKNFIVPIYQGIFPWLAKKNHKEIYQFVKKSIPFISLVGLTLSILIYIFSNTILNLIYNNPNINQYAYLLELFALIPLLSSLNMLFNYLYLNAIKAYQERMKIFLYSGIFNIIIGTILTFYYKINGIVITVLLTEVLLLLLGYYFYRRLYDGQA